MFEKIAALFTEAFAKNFMKIGEDIYREEASVENNGEHYALLQNTNDPSDIQIRRVCEYYEAIEDKAELQSTVEKFKLQIQRANKAATRRRLAIDIMIFALTIAAIIGKSWLVIHRETSIFGHEFVCYGLLAVSFCTIYHRIPTKEAFTTSLWAALGLAIVFTVCVFLLNNWWRYLYKNETLYWGYLNDRYWTYREILESDLKYNIGIGRFRYLLVFLAAASGLLADSAFRRWFKRFYR